MESIMRKALFLLVLCIAGCGGDGGTPPTNSNDNSANDNDNGSTPTTDCQDTSADALVSFDDDDSTTLTATAVTSECDEVAVYSGNGQDVLDVVIVSDDTTIQAEFDENGQVVAARTDDSELTASYNDELSYTRVTIEDDGTTSSNILAVDREVQGQTRVVAGSGTTLDFCQQLQQFSTLLSSGCSGDNPPAFCQGDFAVARTAAERLCGAARIDEVAALQNVSALKVSPTLPLGAEGFATTRPSGEGTTIILSAVTFGGTPPYTVNWSQSSGDSAALSSLPGGAAVVDTQSTTGQFAFDVQVRDVAGTATTHSVAVDLGESSFVGVVIQADSVSPAINEAIELAASGSTATTSVLWDFGDGSTGEGQQVRHAWSQAGAYLVTVVQGVGLDIVTDTIEVIVGGGAGQAVLDFAVALDIEAGTTLGIGSTLTVRAVVQGAVGTPDVAIGLLGHGGAAELLQPDAVDPAEGLAVVFASTAQLRGLATGEIAVGAVAVDAAGRATETVATLAVCGGDQGLFAFIQAPVELALGASTQLSVELAECGATGALAYQWSVSGPAALAEANSPMPTLTSTGPGVVVVELALTPQGGSEVRAAREIHVVGSSQLVVEFLGPFEVPLGQAVPLSGFVGGGVEPFFCAWQINGPAVSLDDHFSCNAFAFGNTTGCVQGQVLVQDARGATGETQFQICAGDFTAQGSPCPIDGVCVADCNFVDPDCFQDFCVDGDFHCDAFCPNPDADCASCGLDGVCILLCESGDPDCGRDLCVCGDGLCDADCPQFDCDCATISCAEDGFCDGACTFDPDCQSVNDALCVSTEFCCAGDSLCDLECPEPDIDCNNCGLDGACVSLCAVADPDCANCDVTFNCDPGCSTDPDCFANCDVTFACDPDCPNDPECPANCDVTFGCDPNCPDDPECPANCDVTFGCDPNCPDDPECFGGSVCGDSVCDLDEDCPSCPQDCCF
jgi:hypothetical protein